MNEQIEELARQAGFHFDEYNEVTRRKVEKFSQLIALKCARLAMTQHVGTSPAEYGDMDSYDQGCDDTASTISGMIRSTFGVQE